MSTTTATWKKDPSDALDWAWDWSRWLQTGETIVSKVVTPASGITVDNSTMTADHVVVWLSGGTVGVQYKVAVKITTNQGRTAERTIRINVEER